MGIPLYGGVPQSGGVVFFLYFLLYSPLWRGGRQSLTGWSFFNSPLLKGWQAEPDGVVFFFSFFLFFSFSLHLYTFILTPVFLGGGSRANYKL